MDVFRTADGRVLEYLEVGDARGQPVVYLHGTPGTAGSAALLDDAGALRRTGGLAARHAEIVVLYPKGLKLALNESDASGSDGTQLWTP